MRSDSMCLIVFAWRAHPDYPLIVAGNRDEFYTRRTRPAAWWGHSVSLLAGQDEEAGGTWLGITRRGRLAALTNVRAPSERNPHAPSRGALVLAALQASERVDRWIDRQAHRTPHVQRLQSAGRRRHAHGREPAGSLHYFSNRLDAPPRVLEPGVYGLSNAFLDTPWPKVTRAVAQLRLLDRRIASASMTCWQLMARSTAGARQRNCRPPACRSTGNARCRRSRSGPMATALAPRRR